MIEIEQHVIGTYATNPDLFEDCSHLVSEHLFTGLNRASYVIIKNNHSKGFTTDAILLLSELKKAGYSQQDLAYQASILTTVNQQTLHNPIPKVLGLFEELIRNRMIPILNEASADFETKSADVFETIDKIKNKITDIEGVVNNVASERNIRDIFDDAANRISNLSKGIIDQPGLSYGLPTLDAKSGGIYKGVNVLAGSPGTGKTSMVINIIKANAIDADVPTIFFSLEMPAIEVMTNIISNITEINSRALRQGDVLDVDTHSIGQVRSKLKDNFVIDDKGGITWQYVVAKIRSYRKKNKLSKTQTILGIIDYLQLMGFSPDEYKGTTEEQRLSRLLNELATVCKNENISLVLLSQFSRQEKDRKTPRPKMSDLKGSGAIEATAITILLLFRPEYHGITVDEQGNDLRGLCEINIAKARYANPEPVYVNFIGKYSKFADLNPSDNVDNKDVF